MRHQLDESKTLFNEALLQKKKGHSHITHTYTHTAHTRSSPEEIPLAITSLKR